MPHINTDAVQQENKCLPLNAEGHVVSPRYVPENSTYLETWREWCRKHPKSEWPEWLKRDLEAMRPGKRTSASRNSTAALQQSTAPTKESRDGE